MENYEETVKMLDVLQRKASILIQGFSFFISIQQESELRNQIKENYQGLIKQVMEVSHAVHPTKK